MPGASSNAKQPKHELTRQTLTTQLAVSDGFLKIVHREAQFRSDKLSNLHKEVTFKNRLNVLENPEEKALRQNRTSPDSCWVGSIPVHRGMPSVPCYSGKSLLQLPLDVNGNIIRPAGTSCGRLHVSLPISGQSVPHPARVMTDRQMADRDNPHVQLQAASMASPLTCQRSATINAHRSSDFQRTATMQTSDSFISRGGARTQTSDFDCQRTATLQPSDSSPSQRKARTQTFDSDSLRTATMQTSDSSPSQRKARTQTFDSDSQRKASKLSSAEEFTLPPSGQRNLRILDEWELLHELDQVNAEAAFVNRSHNTDPPEVSRRLGGMMRRLGPRYKTCSKDMLRDRAEHGEIGVIKKRLMRAKSLGAICANPLDELKDNPNIALEAIEPDEDGDARVRWLRSRARNLNPPLVFLQQLGVSERDAIESLRRACVD